MKLQILGTTPDLQAKANLVTVQLLELSLGQLSHNLANLGFQEICLHTNACLVQAFANQE